MTAAILQFPGVGPAYGGQDCLDNALEAARAIYDGREDAFWVAVSALMLSPHEADRKKGHAAHDARLLAQYAAEEPQEPFIFPEIGDLVEPASLSGGLVACAVAMFIGAAGLVFYLFGGGLW